MTESGATRFSEAELRHHYAVEKELADQLRRASKQERQLLYPKVYDELFRRVPFHGLLQDKHDVGPNKAVNDQKNLRLLSRYADPASTYLEIGAGNCRFALRMASLVKQVYAVDVSAEIVEQERTPENFELVLSDGSSIPLPEHSVDLAFSNQLMEHLHPEDAADQVRNIARALKPGGHYICVTPHRYSGPHDVSRFFDDVATGFHLKEYTHGELRRVFLASGFSAVRTVGRARMQHFGVPRSTVLGLERLLAAMPHAQRRRFARLPGLRILFRSITTVATK